MGALQSVQVLRIISLRRQDYSVTQDTPPRSKPAMALVFSASIELPADIRVDLSLPGKDLDHSHRCSKETTFLPLSLPGERWTRNRVL